MPANAETNLAGMAFHLPLVSRIASIRSQSAARITWHSHDCFEMLLLMDGSTAYEFSDNKTVELPGGHFMIIPPGMLHRGLHDVRRPVRLNGILFDPLRKGAAKHTPFTAADLVWLNSQIVSGAQQAQRMGSELRSLVKAIPPDFSVLDLSCASLIASLRLIVCSILLEAAKQIGCARTFEPKQAVQSAIALMESHIDETISIETVAEAVHCSRARFFDLFKDATGMTPNDYWQRLRIDRAQRLLTGSSKSITEIAMECGFSTSQYFSSVFRKYSGVSPSDYRANETPGMLVESHND